MDDSIKTMPWPRVRSPVVMSNMKCFVLDSKNHLETIQGHYLTLLSLLPDTQKKASKCNELLA